MDRMTVLLATYRQQEYIYSALDSVLMQDYGDIQLIVADDGSEYFSVEETEQYIDAHNRGNITDRVILKNEKNMGTVRNLNRARKHIRGDYVVPLSGDDLFYDEKVLTNYRKAFHGNSETDLVISQVLHYDKEMKNIMFRCVNDEQIALLREGNNRKLYGKVCTECFIPAIGSAYTADILERMGEYDEKYYLVEDWPFFLKLLRNGAKFCYSDFVSAKHRDGGVSHDKKTKAEERADRYHQDLIAIIRNEILPHYKFAEESLQREVYHYASDRVVISEFRSEFRKMKMVERVRWLVKNWNLSAVVGRGLVRKCRFRIGQRRY